jgi:tetratricopeptide (TPR) repeat protein
MMTLRSRRPATRRVGRGAGIAATIVAASLIAAPLVFGAMRTRRQTPSIVSRVTAQPDVIELVERGMIEYLGGHPTEALVIWTKARILHPENALVQNNIGSALMSLGRLEEAQAAFIRASTLAPGESLYTNNLAWARREIAHNPGLVTPTGGQEVR